MNDLHWESDQCCCNGCFESLGISADDVDFTLDPSNTLTDPGDATYDKPIWSAYQTAQHIARTSHTFADDADDPDTWTEVTYRFRDADNLDNPDHVFEDVNQQHTREILDQYADVGDIRFTEITSQTDDADINFQYRDGGNGGGYWNGRDVVVSRVSWEPEMEIGTYNRRLMLHEIGHGMGLSHPGPYNGGGSSYTDDADHWNDTRQYSNMSYWGEGNTGASFGHMSTLALHDILAIQIEYGANMDARIGDDTYGFNATAGDAYDFMTTRTNGSGRETVNTDMAFSIWDAGGADTIDFSGSSSGTELDLRSGAFSSTNGQTYNVSIAYGVTIESGVGSDHDDLIQGNEVSNTLFGGDGNDTLIGGADIADTTVDPRAFIGISLNEDPNVFDQHLQVDDFNGFSNGLVDIDMMISLTRMSSWTIPLVSYATDSNSNTFLVEATANGVVRIHINGVQIETDIATITLIDGQAHRFGVRWDQETGALSVHVDGAIAWEGVHQTGAVIASGGTLIFGQEQDAVGDRFDDRETFQGAIGDIRVFDAPRSDDDIAIDTFTQPEHALAHHWVVAPETQAAIADIGGGGLINLIAAEPDNVNATTSSQYASYDASRLVDGDTSTFAHTQNGAEEFISLRFETAVTGERIEIVNRSGQETRLNGAVVSIYDADGVLIETFAPIADASRGTLHQFAIPDDTLIGEIRITHADQYLNIAEIKVLAQGNDAARDLEIINDAQPIAIGGLNPEAEDADVLHGGAGHDTLFGGHGDDVLNGDNGNDALYGGMGDDDLNGGNGADVIRDSSGDDVVTGGGGADMITALSGTNTIDGGAEGDLITGGIGADTLDGGYGNDVLVGDISQSFFGNDVLAGGAGDDMLQGGRGADTFVFQVNDGADTIAQLDIDFDDIANTRAVGADFQVNVDTLDLTAFGYETAQDALGQFEMIDGHVTFVDQGTQIVLFDVSLSDLSAQNIIYL